VEELKQLLKEAQRDPWAFFVKHKLKDLLVQCHPDKHPGNDTATLLFTGFSAAFELTKKEPLIFGKYRVTRHLCDGDLRSIYACDDKIVKVPLVDSKSANKLAKKEAGLLTLFSEKAAGLSYQYYFPSLVDSFSDNGKLINVTSHREVLYSVADLLKKFPNGLEGRHIGWMAKRILTVLGFVHYCGYTHGAITPEHIMFGPSDHSGVLTGWIHAEKHGDKIKTIPASRRSLYPDFAKDGLTPKVDIAMMGKSLTLLAGDLPKRLKNFLKALSLGVAGSAWDLEEDLSSILKDTYGAPKFVELTV
jgi:serine/threonine protein kinase